jgi:hypothetical protein
MIFTEASKIYLFLYQAKPKPINSILKGINVEPLVTF